MVRHHRPASSQDDIVLFTEDFTDYSTVRDEIVEDTAQLELTHSSTRDALDDSDSESVFKEFSSDDVAGNRQSTSEDEGNFLRTEDSTLDTSVFGQQSGSVAQLSTLATPSSTLPPHATDSLHNRAPLSFSSFDGVRSSKSSMLFAPSPIKISSAPIAGTVPRLDIQQSQGATADQNELKRMALTAPVVSSPYMDTSGRLSPSKLVVRDETQISPTVSMSNALPQEESNPPASVSRNGNEEEKAAILTEESDSDLWISAMYIKQNMSVPTATLYPHAPPVLFDWLHPKQILNTLESISNGMITFQIQTSQPVKITENRNIMAMRNTVKLEIKNTKSIVGRGDGFSQAEALSNATMSAVCQLHMTGTMSTLFPAFAVTKDTCGPVVPLNALNTASASTTGMIGSKSSAVFALPMNQVTSKLCNKMLHDLGPQNLPENWQGKTGTRDRDQGFANNRSLTSAELTARQEELIAHQKNLERQMKSLPRFIGIKEARDSLTLNQHRDEILDLVSNNKVSILVSGTGSGKTTQLPQMLLEDAMEKGIGANCNIVCTQPRKIAATSVARRVAAERNDGALKSVGHHVRFDCNPPKPGGSISYETTGVFLQKLQHSPTNALLNISHIIVDETHERDINIDSLLAILKRELDIREKSGLPLPKVILASATLDVPLFSKYFMQYGRDGSQRPCPSLTVPGRLYHVEHVYLPDILHLLKAYSQIDVGLLTKDKNTAKYLKLEKDFAESKVPVTDLKPNEQDDALIATGLVTLTIAHIAKTTTEGAILVFLPGLPTITKVESLLSSESPILGIDFDNSRKYKIILLHSSLANAQTEVFESVPKGCRKIILSTNIAETSVTISDVKYVVDTGKHMKKMYDPTKLVNALQCSWISQSSAKQRAGRAGRVQSGYYYALYSRKRADHMRANDLPEIMCSDLQEVCLSVAELSHSYKLPIRDFLATLIEPPSTEAVSISMTALKSMGALTDNEHITALGRVLESFPVHPSLGKMILLGIIFRCLDPMIILAASFGQKDMFLRPLEARKDARDTRIMFSKDSSSDQLAVINAFSESREYGESYGENMARTWLHHNFIHFNSFRELYLVAERIETALIDQHVMPVTEGVNGYWLFGPRELNINSKNESLIKALMVAGFNSNVAVSKTPQVLRTLHADSAVMSHQSVNHMGRQGRPPGSLFTFAELSKDQAGGYLIRENTAISPLMAILFGRTLRQKGGNLLEVDGWLQFQLDTNQQADVLAKLKDALETMLASAYIELQTKGGGLRYLHDNTRREKFAGQLVKLLDMDVEGYAEYLAKAPIQEPKKKRKTAQKESHN